MIMIIGTDGFRHIKNLRWVIFLFYIKSDTQDEKNIMPNRFFRSI